MNFIKHIFVLKQMLTSVKLNNFEFNERAAPSAPGFLVAEFNNIF